MRLNEHKGKAKWDATKTMAEDGNKLKSSLGGPGEEGAFIKSSPCLTITAPPAMEEDGVVAKAVARRRSLFSLGMSLAVGAVAWSADAPCLPLMAGLFAMVGVSMRSCHALRRAGDTVALLSLNWFLLGVLTSPMLPGVARALVPCAGRALGPALTWFAATAPL